MAKYNISGIGESLFDAFGAGKVIKGNLLYVNAVQFGVQNADGSTTHVYGKQFSYDAATGEFTGGTISNIRHFDPDGRYIDDITGLAASARDFQPALEGGSLGALLLSGDDMLVAAYLKSDPGNASLNGFDGNDKIYGSRADDQLLGGDGNDTIGGRRGGDVIDGGNGDDTVNGGIGRDGVSGGDGADVIKGGTSGDDILTGGAGGDTFVFNLIRERPDGKDGSRWNHDTITDFEVGVDGLDIHTPANTVITYANDADGNAVITADGTDSITLIGVDATKVPLGDLLI